MAKRQEFEPGARGGSLTLICEVKPYRNGNRKGRFRCDCGGFVETELLAVLTRGVTKQCRKCGLAGSKAKREEWLARGWKWHPEKKARVDQG